MGRTWKCLKKVITFVLLTAMVFQPLTSMSVQAAEVRAADQYEIYPTPHKVTYEADSFIIRSSVNIVYEEGIDDVTKDKLDAVLESKGIKGTVSDKIVSGTTNILVGIKDSNGYVDQYADKNIEYDASIFEHYDPYVLSIDNGTITVLGETTDGAFYGIVSLMHIFDQIDGRTIRNLVIEDYADTQTRGFIEGYYGIPWSNEDRMSLMEFGGQFKMTSYVFAPKDDPYHSSQWRTLYPEDELAEIAEMAAVGNANKCRFVWTIHPFMYSAISEATYDADIATIKAKFEQLYGVGVRQFGVLGDDVGSLPRSLVIRTMEDLQAWADSKGDVYSLLFCPAGYNDSWQGDYSELNDYDAGFPEEVQIFWTGQAVCQPVEQSTLTNFRTKYLATGQEERRSPLFWLNWPVNDINMSRLLMGKGSLLHNDVNPEDLAGVVTNPMQDAESSKVALFAVADYAWNIADFDDDQSWADGFKYIDADASEALHTLAKHMSDPSPNGHGLVLAESEELQPLLDEFKADYEAGTYNAEAGAQLIAEFEEIIAACDDFHKLSQNENLKEEILPFSNALKALSNAVINLIKTAKALEDGDSANVWSYYSSASAELAASENIYRATLNGTAAALPGSKHIRPFADKLNELLSVAVNGIVDDSKLITTLITNRTDTPSGALEKLTDNNESTEVIWSSPNSTTAGTYIGLSFSKPITLNDVTFKMGQSGNERDTFDAGKIQYTVDGKEWIDLEGTEFTTRVNNVTKDGLDLQVKGVRLISTADKTNMWLGCKDIIVNIDSYATEEDASPLNKTVIRTSSWSVYDGSEGNLTDGNVGSGVWYSTASNNHVSLAGEYLGLDLGAVVAVGTVSFAVGIDGGDKWESYKLEYSTDNSNWTTFKTYTGVSSGQDVQEEDFGGIEARYVRITNLAQKGCWVKFGEFNVERYVVDTGSQYIYTNVDAYKTLGAEHSEDKVSVAAKAGVTLKPGEYLGVKLNRIKDIINIETDAVTGLTLESSKNEIVWTAVAGDTYEDARFVRLVNKTAADVTFDLTKFVVESFEIQPISVVETNFSNAATHLYAFDQDRTTEAILEYSQVTGRFITYDLGQIINLNSLKLVLHDGTTDYPRHGKVSVSADGESWTEIMLIGNQDSNNPGEAENTDNIAELFPDHEISYYTKSVQDLDEQVRFIKFEITRNKAGADKWVRFREIELNGGEMYLPSDNDPTVVTTAGESTGNTAMNIIDGDVSTTYAPLGEEAGSVTYYISENTEINKITILQSPSTISNAEVIVEAVENGTVKEVTVGKLSSSLNEFNTSSFDNVLSVKVVWTEGNVPEIHEVITSTAVVAAADKAVLNAYYEAHKSEDTSSWTADSKDAYTAAAAMAKEVLANDYATQAMVDSAYVSLKNAVDNKVEVGNLAAFEAAVAEIEAAVLAEENYTAKSWRVYAERLAAAKAADAQLSQAELDALLAALEAAKEGLVYEISSMEELTLLVETVKALNEEDYAKASYDSLMIVVASAETLIEEGKTERQNPVNVKAMIAQLEEVAEALVDLTELKNVIAEAEEITNFDGYTQGSIDRFNAALEAARAVCAKADASKEEVAAAANALEAAMTFDVTGDASAVTAEIARLKALNEADYTAASYAAMMTKIAEIEAALEDTYTDEDCAAWAQELSQVSGALVNVKALKAAVAEAKALEAANYTEASYEAFMTAIAEMEALYVDGSQEAVDAAAASVEGMIAELHIAAAICKAEMDTYKAALAGNYTEASKKTLEDAVAAAEAQAEAGMTQAALDQAKAELAELVELLVSTDALLGAIESAEAVATEGYTAASVAEYQAVIAGAKDLLKAGTVTEIADMVKALNEAGKLLVKKGDFSKLLDAIVYWKEEYQKLDADKYTTASKNDFLGEVERAEFMVLTGEASEEQVEAQIKALEDAYESLKKVEDTSSQPTTPSQPVQPSAPTAPATGDSSMLTVYLAAMMLAVFVFAAAKRKKHF